MLLLQSRDTGTSESDFSSSLYEIETLHLLLQLSAACFLDTKGLVKRNIHHVNRTIDAIGIRAVLPLPYRRSHDERRSVCIESVTY